MTLNQTVSRGQSFRLLRKILEYTKQENFLVSTFQRSKEGKIENLLYALIDNDNPESGISDEFYVGATVLEPEKG